MLACQDNQDCLDSLDIKTGEIVSTVPPCYASCVKTGEIVLMLHARCVEIGEIVSTVPPCYAPCVKTGEIVLMLHAHCVKTGEIVLMLPVPCIKTGEIVSMHAASRHPCLSRQSRDSLSVWSLDFPWCPLAWPVA